MTAHILNALRIKSLILYPEMIMFLVILMMVSLHFDFLGESKVMFLFTLMLMFLVVEMMMFFAKFKVIFLVKVM